MIINIFRIQIEPGIKGYIFFGLNIIVKILNID